MAMVVIDTEFNGFHDSSEIISIALVATDGREYYAEIIDTLAKAVCKQNEDFALEDMARPEFQEHFDDFVVDQVMPQLDPMAFGKSRKQVAEEVLEFFRGCSGQVVLASDSPAWDFVMLKQLLGQKWPKNLSRTVRDVVDVAGISELLDSGSEPVTHHALDDAKRLMEAMERVALVF